MIIAVVYYQRNVVDIAMCYINIRFAQSTMHTLIGGELKTTLAFINVSATWHCRVNKLTARLTLGRFIVRRSVGHFVLVCIGLYCSRVIAYKVSQLQTVQSEHFDSYQLYCFPFFSYYILLFNCLDGKMSQEWKALYNSLMPQFIRRNKKVLTPSRPVSSKWASTPPQSKNKPM